MGSIVEAVTPEQVEGVRQLLREYAAWLGIHLCFQDFDQELATLPGCYAPPGGRLLLALEGDAPVGCVGLRALGSDVCEMKRLYVRPTQRGSGLGRLLVRRVLADAHEAGYTRMHLHTLPMMRSACRLYAALGFQEFVPTGATEPGIHMQIELPAPETAGGRPNTESE